MAKEITQGLIFGFVAIVIVAFLGSQVGFGCSHYEPSGVGEDGAAEAPAAAAEAEAEQQAETSEDEEGQTAE